MKYFQNYNDYIDYVDNDINEASKFWEWLLRSGKAKRYGRDIANARFRQQERELQLKNEKLDNDDDAENFTPDEIAELKTYEDEAINVENQLDTWLNKNNSSEYLRNVAKQAELEQENANIKKLRGLAKDKKSKTKYDKIVDLNKKQANLIKQDNDEFSSIVKKHKNGAGKSVNFDPDAYRNQKKMNLRKDQLSQLELQKANMQKDEMKNRLKISSTRGEILDYKSREAEQSEQSYQSNREPIAFDDFEDE